MPTRSLGSTQKWLLTGYHTRCTETPRTIYLPHAHIYSAKENNGLRYVCCVLSLVSEAPRGPAGDVSVPVSALVGISRRSRLQEGFPQPAGSSAQVAKGVWRRTHSCALPVSNVLAACVTQIDTKGSNVPILFLKSSCCC